MLESLTAGRRVVWSSILHRVMPMIELCHRLCGLNRRIPQVKNRPAQQAQKPAGLFDFLTAR